MGVVATEVGDLAIVVVPQEVMRQLQVTSYKLQVTSYNYKLLVTSYSLQVTSYKLQATSYKLPCRDSCSTPRSNETASGFRIY